MSFEDYKTKESVVVVYTGEGKGKTSASVGLLARSLGSGWKAAYIQFIKHWNVGEHDFIHKKAAKDTFDMALKAAVSGDYDIVICDEINNAVHHNLIPKSSIKTLIDKRSPKTSLCLTGRDFPEIYLPLVDIATNMAKIRHHFDDKYLANKGIDF
jgi:cob(I)alamin adenosyltransferase